MICFHFSIFEPLETAEYRTACVQPRLWFAFILVSLNHWKQHNVQWAKFFGVVICFHFSIFEPLETADLSDYNYTGKLWFAFILVSLNHWKQPTVEMAREFYVVICFHFSIFEPLETACGLICWRMIELWFAFILVSLNHWKQRRISKAFAYSSCDLLSF